MRAPALILGAWALSLTALAIIGWIWIEDDLPPALLSAAAIATAAVAVVAGLRGQGSGGGRLLADSGLPVVAIVVGLAMVLNGLAFGLWLVLIGAEVVALGVFVLGRQMLFERRRQG